MAPFSRACVVGLGVVGIPVAAKLAEAGIPTTGVDIDPVRVAAINAGKYPMASKEPGLEPLIAGLVGSGTLRAKTDAAAGVPGADVVVVVVQTPTEADGRPRYAALRTALADVGRHLAPGALVVVESTIAPGTMRKVVQPVLEEASGQKAGAGFLLGHCPERVMPGKLLQNIVHYDRVVGGFDAASTDRMMELYRLFVQGRLFPTDMTTAEVVKTTENAYRDVQIAFANEVASICQELGVDAWEVREHVNRVEGRNMHMPGVGVGGHCIPKDGLLLASSARDVEPDMLRLARRINDDMPERTARLVEETVGGLHGQRVAVLGASYLPGSDDVRHTPSLPLARALEQRGAEVRLHDPLVQGSLEGRSVLAALDDALADADAVVLATAHPAYLEPAWDAWGDLMARRVAVDGRGAWDPEKARTAGFIYRGVGR